MLICAPLSSRSGYGDHARDLFHAFDKLQKFNIKVMDTRWGNCPRNALSQNNKGDKRILECIIKPGEQINIQPDVYVDIRIPNEFQTHGKINIGITAGIETDIISPEWIDGCNKMDLVIVPSEHSKRGFVNTIYDAMQNLPDGSQQKTGEHRINKPVEVLFEGIDVDVFKRKTEISAKIDKKINDVVKEDFAFLFVGLWGKGDYGDDRKDISKMIKVFYESFANKKKQPALIIKTNGAGFSVLDLVDTKQKIKTIKSAFPSNYNLPQIYLLHGDLTREEMNDLYNHSKIKSMVSFTHGEGFGRPLLEFSMTGKPIIASGWSGQLDFLDNEASILLPGEMKQVPKSQVWKGIIVENSKWFNVDEDKAYDAYNYVFNNYFDVKLKSKKMLEINKKKFSLDNMSKKLNDIISKFIENIPIQQELKLPKLKKIEKTSTEKIKLPKLKRV